MRQLTTVIRKLLIILTLLGAAAVLAGCSTDPASETPAEDITEDTAASVDDQAVDDSAPIYTAAYAPDAPVLTLEFSPVDPGQYRVEHLGTPFTFEIEGEWWVQESRNALIALTHPQSREPGDRDVVFMRPRGLAHPANPTVAVDDEEWWDLDDLDGWIKEAESQSVEITNREAVTLGDRSAERFDLTVPSDFECNPNHPWCLGFAESISVTGKAFEKRYSYRIYWVEDDFEPIAIIVGDQLGGTEWFAVADDFLSTAAFGDSVPHPAPLGGDDCLAGYSCDAEAGTLVVPAAGGLSMELSEPRFIYQESGLLAVTLNGPGAVFVLAVVSDGDGNALETYTEVVNYLVESGLTPSDVVADLPFDGTALDVAGMSGDVFLKWDEALRSYRVERIGRVWVLDTPRGPIYVMAEAGEAGAKEAAIALAEEILPTFELVELDD